MSKLLSEINRKPIFPIRTMQDINIPLSHRIEMLEKYMLQMPQVECPIREFFGDGTYAREVFMPAGTFAIGRIHNFEHLSIMISGELYMWTEDDDLVHLEGYNPVRAKDGVKRIGYVIKDLTWITFHKIGEGVSSENVEDYLSAASYKEYLDFKENSIKRLTTIV